MYELSTLEEVDLNKVKSFKEWKQLILPSTLSDELRYLFRKMTMVDPYLRPSAKEILDEINKRKLSGKVIDYAFIPAKFEYLILF